MLSEIQIVYTKNLFNEKIGMAFDVRMFPD
jgi:hypothetical protein